MSCVYTAAQLRARSTSKRALQRPADVDPFYCMNEPNNLHSIKLQEDARNAKRRGRPRRNTLEDGRPAWLTENAKSQPQKKGGKKKNRKPKPDAKNTGEWQVFGGGGVVSQGSNENSNANANAKGKSKSKSKPAMHPFVVKLRELLKTGDHSVVVVDSPNPSNGLVDASAFSWLPDDVNMDEKDAVEDPALVGLMAGMPGSPASPVMRGNLKHLRTAYDASPRINPKPKLGLAGPAPKVHFPLFAPNSTPEVERRRRARQDSVEPDTKAQSASGLASGTTKKNLFAASFAAEVAKIGKKA